MTLMPPMVLPTKEGAGSGPRYAPEVPPPKGERNRKLVDDGCIVAAREERLLDIWCRKLQEELLEIDAPIISTLRGSLDPDRAALLLVGKTRFVAPTEAEFQEQIENILAGKASGLSKKCRKMTWCLAEAVKAIDQEAVAASEAISLYRDERKGRILIRFRAVGKDLQTVAGCLGQERDGGTGSRNLTVATYRIMQRFCTRFIQPPEQSKQPAVLKRRLLSHLRSTVTSLSVDAAQDEVVLAELMRAKALNASIQKLTRTDESSSRAKRFLSWVSDEKMLQAAMLADAADSSLHFTRLMDREDLDPAVLSTECHMYLASMKALFCGGQIFDRFGFTSTMMKTLAQPMVFQVGAETRCLGDAAGVAADVKTICLQRMQSWIRLAEAALQAEFPEFELAQAFQMFDLAGSVRRESANVERVAQALGLNHGTLQAQWQDVFPRAQRLRSAACNPHAGGGGGSAYSADYNNDNNKAAWQEALARLTEHHGTRKIHPTETLRQALVQYFAFGCSASGVEQSFSTAAWSVHSRRRKALAGTEEYLVKLSLDLGNRNRERVIRIARASWAACFGQPRTCHRRERVDKGLRKKKEDGQILSEAAFLRKRRHETVLAGLSLSEGSSAYPEADGSHAWTESHQKEMDFQLRKRKARKIQGFAENSLLQSEMTGEDTQDALSAAAQKCRQDLLDNDDERARKQRNWTRLEKGLAPAQMLRDLQGQKCFMAASANTMALQAAMQSSGLVQVQRLSMAGVIVTDRPGRMENDSHALVSALRGFYEVSPTFLANAGKGAAIKLRPAAYIKRAVFVSSACATTNKSFWTFLRQALPQGHKWLLHKADVGSLKTAAAAYKAGVAFSVVLPAEHSLPATCLH
ncbi:unnamed protein product [Symbiodinium microadriaticum]|nr:unnamed protein product [Symbiodinium microadriaticum]